MKMEEWKECKLGDITSLITKGTTPSMIGANFTTNGINFIKSECILENSRLLDSSKYTFISSETNVRLKRSQIIENDILFSMAGMFLGKTGIATKDDVPANTNQAVAIIRIISEKADFKYVYYFLNQKTLITYINGISGQSAQPNINLQQIGDLVIKLPSLPTQQKIAAILSSLDDKIELNNKINTNLEQQAGALFKNWFVDFEPFGGKMPEGWKEIPLEELCTVVTKGTTPTTLGKKFTDSGINFIKGESILDNHTFDLQKISHIDDETNLMLKRSIIQPNDILFTIAGTLGRFAIIDETLTPANTNQAVGIIRANPEIISPYYLYSFFIGNWHNDYYTKRIQQAVQANLSLGTIKSLPIIIPDSQNLDKYTALIEPLFKQMKQFENENIKLSTLRDALLPKLMNGEIQSFLS